MIELKNLSCFDYLKTLESNSVDLVLIDPPYEVSRDTNFSSGEPRVLKKSGTIICFYDVWKLSDLKEYFEKAKFKQLRLLIWEKTNPVPINSKVNYLTNSREIAVSGVKGGKPTFHSEYDNGIYRFPICHEKGRFHPTQKPLELIKALIEKHSNEGDLVLDCFSGSGTTAVACIETKRNFVGCEIYKEYYDKSIARIEQHKAKAGSF